MAETSFRMSGFRPNPFYTKKGEKKSTYRGYTYEIIAISGAFI